MQKFKGIEIPQSARDWELYSSKKGSADAAKALTTRLKGTLCVASDLFRTRGVTEKNVATLLAEAVKMTGFYELMCSVGFGASDTEPRYHAGQALVDFAKRVLECEGEYRPDFADQLPF
jgi:hypothetical protein